MVHIIYRAFDKPAYRVNYKNILQDMQSFKILVPFMYEKLILSITHLMFFQSVMSEMLYFVSGLHIRKKVE